MPKKVINFSGIRRNLPRSACTQRPSWAHIVGRKASSGDPLAPLDQSLPDFVRMQITHPMDFDQKSIGELSILVMVQRYWVSSII